MNYTFTEPPGSLGSFSLIENGVKLFPSPGMGISFVISSFDIFFISLFLFQPHLVYMICFALQEALQCNVVNPEQERKKVSRASTVHGGARGIWTTNPKFMGCTSCVYVWPVKRIALSKPFFDFGPSFLCSRNTI